MTFTANPIYVLGFLCLLVIISEWLAKQRVGKNMGSALIVIILGAIAANSGLIPTASNTIPLYAGIFNYIAPISIFFLLLGVNLKNIKKAGIPMLAMFLLGSLGTVVGVIVGMWVVDGEAAIGEMYNGVAGMFVGTYTGGSVNFNALALSYKVNESGTLYAGSVAVDNIITTLWMLISLTLPQILSRMFGNKNIVSGDQNTNEDKSTEKLELLSFAILAATGLGALWISNLLAEWLQTFGWNVPSIIIITTIALVLAQTKYFSNIRGAQMLGLLCVYIFLAVIGAYCEIAALADLKSLGPILLIFTSITVLIHGLIIYGIGGFFIKDWKLLSIASQANVGGSTTAMALAKTHGRNDLILPAIFIGTLGNALGTYLGFLVAGLI